MERFEYPEASETSLQALGAPGIGSDSQDGYVVVRSDLQTVDAFLARVEPASSSTTPVGYSVIVGAHVLNQVASKLTGVGVKLVVPAECPFHFAPDFSTYYRAYKREAIDIAAAHTHSREDLMKSLSRILTLPATPSPHSEAGPVWAKIKLLDSFVAPAGPIHVTVHEPEQDGDDSGDEAMLLATQAIEDRYQEQIDEERAAYTLVRE
jgi:hypothetical protein